jgi:hypothetical protein
MNKIQYGSLFLLLLAFSANAKPMATMNEKTFELKSHELSIQQPAICPGDLKNNSTGTVLNLGNSTGNLTCSLCHVLVNVIDAEIQHGNHTIVEITEIIKDICSLIKGPSGTTCVLVANNIKNIVEWISHGMTDKQICTQLHLCNSTSVKVL